jgi:hypothetical protein
VNDGFAPDKEGAVMVVGGDEAVDGLGKQIGWEQGRGLCLHF